VPGQNFTGAREMYHRRHRPPRFPSLRVHHHGYDFSCPRLRDDGDGAVRRAQIYAANVFRGVAYRENTSAASHRRGGFRARLLRRSLDASERRRRRREIVAKLSSRRRLRREVRRGGSVSKHDVQRPASAPRKNLESETSTNHQLGI